MAAFEAQAPVVYEKVVDILHHMRNVDDVRKRLCHLSNDLRKSHEQVGTDAITPRYPSIIGTLQADIDRVRNELAFCVGHLSLGEVCDGR